MGNFEIFSQPGGLVVTLFALGCLLVAGILAAFVFADKFFADGLCL